MNPQAPLEYTVDAAGAKGPVMRDGLGKAVRIEKPAALIGPSAYAVDIALPVKAATGRDTVRIAVDYYYCREGAEAVCKIGSAAWIVPLELSGTAGQPAVRLRQRAK